MDTLGIRISPPVRIQNWASALCPSPLMYSISKQIYQITQEETQQAHTATDLYRLTSHNYIIITT